MAASVRQRFKQKSLQQAIAIHNWKSFLSNQEMDAWKVVAKSYTQFEALENVRVKYVNFEA